MLRRYNIASVITDSPDPKLQYLSDVSMTADHVFIRLHGRNKGYWYNYLYSKDELQPWADKVKQMAKGLSYHRLETVLDSNQASQKQ